MTSIRIYDESRNEDFLWTGAGWYAPRNTSTGILNFWCGGDPGVTPDPHGLGTPEWFPEDYFTPEELEG